MYRNKVPKVKETKKDILRCSTNRKDVSSDMIISSYGEEYIIIAGSHGQVFRKIYLLVAWTNTNVQIIAMEVTIMANVITDTLVSKKLQLSVAESGDSTITRTFTRINADATKEDLYKAAKAIAGLMSNTVAGYYHSERSLLAEVASEG